MKLLLDTDVLIDYFERRQPSFESIVELRVMEGFGDVELWVSANSFTDVLCVLSTRADPQELQAAMSASLTFFKVCSINGTDIERAFEAGWNDFEDCLVSICAQKVKADFIIARDEKDFTKSKTPSMSPRRFVEWCAEEKGVTYEEIDFPVEEFGIKAI